MKKAAIVVGCWFLWACGGESGEGSSPAMPGASEVPGAQDSTGPGASGQPPSGFDGAAGQGGSGLPDLAGQDGSGQAVAGPLPAGTEQLPPAEFAGVEPFGCVTDVSAGVHDLMCDTYRHILTVPEECTRRACGMIVDVHGGTMDAVQENNNTNMQALGQEHGYLVVQPSSPGNNWVPGAGDAAIETFMQDMFEAFDVDRRRVHMMGFSQGGFMTWRFVCAHADWFASVAPGGAGVGGGLSPASCAFNGSEAPSAELPILHMQGTQDAMVLYDTVTPLRDAIVAYWDMEGPEMIDGDDTFRRFRYTSAAGTVYDFLEHDYTSDANFFGVAIVGHCYPGSTDHTPSVPGQLMGYGCKGDNSFHYGQEAIAFFEKHPRK